MTPLPPKLKPLLPGGPKSSHPGFYSPQLSHQEVSDLEAILAEGLEDEIAMLRVATRRLLELSRELDAPKEMAQVLGALGLASTRLAVLLKTQNYLQGQSAGRDVSAAISQALSEVVRELSGGQ